jgi:hypothetical protein
MRLPVVLLSGPAGSGKDTVAGFLRAAVPGASVFAMADPMKRLAKALFGFTDDQLWGPSARRAESVRVPPGVMNRAWHTGREWLAEIGQANEDAHCSLRDWAINFLPGSKVTARHVLQTLGTEWGRAIDPDLWVDIALRRARQDLAAGAPLAVITDGRFRNEVLAVRSAGGAVIRLVTPDAPGLEGSAARHSSETEQATIPFEWFDAVLLNDKAAGLEQLRGVVQHVAGALMPRPAYY